MRDLLLTYYGDDFTGSTDAMEVLTWAGLPTVLFVEPPDEARLARFEAIKAVGVAGESRGRSPHWMSENLPGIFGRLKALGAPLCHYKVCSTFDSSPEVGSLGRALEIGLDVFGAKWAPLVVGAPKLNRYQAFGNLFATVGGKTHRLDRHPTMSRHPVTPMDEADLRRHLARQTALEIGLVDLLALKGGAGRQRLDEEIERGARAIFLDVIDEESLELVGELIWANRSAAPFTVSSSGLEYALTAHWRAQGAIGGGDTPSEVGEVDRLAVVSGSCSPETEASIRWALNHGYEGIRVEVDQDPGGGAEPAVGAALRAASQGRSFVIYSSLGRDDAAFVAGDAALQVRLAERLGRIARETLVCSGVRRAIICGGDTSSSVGRSLGGYALTAIRPMTAGSPLCRMWSDDELDGLEIVLKGGQRGGPRFFEEVRTGVGAAED